MTTVVISQPMLFPWPGMFEQMALADVFVHYDDVQFSKGSFTNRVQLKTAEGPTWMTVPLRKLGLGTTIEQLEANDDRDWRGQHLRQLKDAYSDAPFIDEVVDLVTGCYRSDLSLADLLMQAAEDVGGWLGVTDGTRFARSSQLGIGGSGWPRVLEVVQHFGGTIYVTGHGARGYLDAEAFAAAGIEVRFMDYACTAYSQLHGDFTPYVSVLDLLANLGPQATTAIAPRTVDWREFLARKDGSGPHDGA
jgi:hypothetical protein